jgi:hypothetical protein
MLKTIELITHDFSGDVFIDGKHTGDEMRDLHYQILMVPK